MLMTEHNEILPLSLGMPSKVIPEAWCDISNNIFKNTPKNYHKQLRTVSAVTWVLHSERKYLTSCFLFVRKVPIFKVFFPFTLRSENHPFWDVRVRNTCFLRSASLLVEKHFCRIHYSFSICHSCQVIDLLLMTSQKSLSELFRQIKIQWKDTIEAKYQKSLQRRLKIIKPVFQEKFQWNPQKKLRQSASWYLSRQPVEIS